MNCELQHRTILLLGDSGKLGQALAAALPASQRIVRHNSSTVNADDFQQVRRIIGETEPGLVINTIAALGIDPCERDPERAWRINTLLPQLLARCSEEFGFTLVHFSSDAVFCDRAQGAYSEEDAPSPINIYGLTKYGGDRCVQEIATRHYLFRLPLLFGPGRFRTQFVDKMLTRARSGETPLRIADDILITPGYTPHLAAAVVARIATASPYGLYHLANSGTTSLYGLMEGIVSRLGLPIKLERASHRDFAALGKKNTRTPLMSLKAPPLPPWERAVDDYCQRLLAEWDTP